MMILMMMMIVIAIIVMMMMIYDDDCCYDYYDDDNVYIYICMYMCEHTCLAVQNFETREGVDRIESSDLLEVVIYIHNNKSRDTNNNIIYMFFICICYIHIFLGVCSKLCILVTQRPKELSPEQRHKVGSFGWTLQIPLKKNCSIFLKRIKFGLAR